MENSIRNILTTYGGAPDEADRFTERFLRGLAVFMPIPSNANLSRKFSETWRAGPEGHDSDRDPDLPHHRAYFKSQLRALLKNVKRTLLGEKMRALVEFQHATAVTGVALNEGSAASQDNNDRLRPKNPRSTTTGAGPRSRKQPTYRQLGAAREYVHNLHLKRRKDWMKYTRPHRPPKTPVTAAKPYGGWKRAGDSRNRLSNEVGKQVRNR
jgi:hypothetical protein